MKLMELYKELGFKEGQEYTIDKKALSMKRLKQIQTIAKEEGYTLTIQYLQNELEEVGHEQGEKALQCLLKALKVDNGSTFKGAFNLYENFLKNSSNQIKKVLTSKQL